MRDGKTLAEGSMRRTFLVVLVVLASFVGPGTTGAANREDYIVVLRDGVDLRSTLQDQVRRVKADVIFIYGHALNGYAARLTPPGVAALKKDRRVLYVFKDRPVELDAQDTPTGVMRVGAAQPRAAGPPATGLLGDSRGAGVGVAVIDTGIDLNHPDLGRVVPGANCVRRAALPNDDNGHGSHVAGTIAARDNDLGVVGVAPEATLFAVKAFNASGGGTWISIICGIDWVAANAELIRVANLSFSSHWRGTASDATCKNSNNDPMHTAICLATLAGVAFVVSAGNDAADASKYVPAGYEEVITVSALADSDGAAGGLGGPPACYPLQLDDHFATFSNFGDVVDLAAPGVCIESTTKDGGYAVMSGTSMSSPHVAGVAALYIGSHPAARPAEVRVALIATAEPGPIPGDPDASPEGVVHVSTPGPPVIGLPTLPPIDPPAPPPLPDPGPLPLPPIGGKP
jgi:subtilisin family serine protease